MCQPNWVGAGCSQRQCPYGAAFADSALGDLNHDGDVSVADTIAAGDSQTTDGSVNEVWQGLNQAEDEAHFYAECSGKGICDRSSGECACFGGYTGHACQRSSCPSDCSGHGVCRTLREIAAGGLNKRLINNELGVRTYEGVQTAFAYNLWDADKAQACICDAGYTGYDCSMRDCPRGDDPLTTSTRWHGNAAAEWAKVVFRLGAPSGDTVLKIGFKGWSGFTNYAYAKLSLQEDAPGSISSDGLLPGVDTTAGKLTIALRNMPGGLLQKVTVTSESVPATNPATPCATPGTCDFVVEFVSRPGQQELLSVEDVSHPAASSAVIVAPAFVTSGGNAIDGNREEITCSGRGLCDYSSGLCECFAGYFGASCEHQNALAGGSAGGGALSAPVGA